MKNASIDFGNTRVKVGLFKNQELLDIFRVGTLSETAELLRANSVDNAIVSSVTISNT
jgi:pantothenate kinase type III